MASRNVIMLRLILLNNLDFVIDKCQTGVMSTTCYWPTDASCHWPNSNRVRRRFATTSFFLIDECAYSQSFCGLFGMITINIFSSVNQELIKRWDSERELLRSAPGSYPNSL